MSTYTSDIYSRTKVNSKGLSLINRELGNIYKKALSTPLDTVFNIKFNGFEFNCLPFLVTGSSYFSDRFRSSLLQSISMLKPANEYVDISDLHSLDSDVLESLYPASMDYGTRYLCYYLYEENPRELIRLFINGAAEVYQAIVYNQNLIHYDFEYKDICNTQAFCYYTSLNWLFSFSPLLVQLSMQMLNKINFKQLYHSLCPVDSIHFKYIKGEITARELKEQYLSRSFSDDSSICLREVYSVTTEGRYDGRDLTNDEICIAYEIYDLNTRDREYKLNMALGYCYLTYNTFKKSNKKIEDLSAQCEILSGIDEEYKKKISDIKNDLHSANKEIKRLKSENLNLQGKLNAVKTDDDLVSEISRLKDELSELKSENMQLFSERLELKHQVSSQKKQIKSLSASLTQLNQEHDEISEELTDIEESLGLDEMCNRLRGSYITLIGCESTNSLDKTFESHGFKHISRFDSNKRTLGKCDYCIIFTTCCKHTSVYKAESLCRGTDTKIIYANCINFEQLINQIYKEDLCE